MCFSGRFDSPHCGHVKNIQMLGAKYGLVRVVVLDHKEQRYSPQYRAQVLRDILEQSVGEYDVVVNDIHFGEITKEQLCQFEFDVYASGNSDVLRHIDSLGYELVFVDRAYDYEANEDRKLRKIKDALI